MHRHHGPPGFGGRDRHGYFASQAGFFGRFGGGSHGGMRATKMFAAGDLQLIILALLAEKPRHGYEIMKALTEHSRGVYTPSPGMVYPALTYLEEMGYAASETAGTKKLYRLTEAGTAYLAQHRATVDAALQHLTRFGRRMEQFQQFADDDEAAEEFAAPPRHRDKQEWRQMKLEFRALRDELKAVLSDKLDAPMEEKQRILGILKRAIAEIRSQ